MSKQSWRLNGNLTKKDEIGMHLQLGNFEILKHKDYQNRVNEVCTLLKQVFGDLSDNVIPFDVFDEMVKSIKDGKELTHEEKL
jgi:hypothetical protein